MKLTRILAIIVSTTLIFTACSKDSDEAVVAVSENTNPLLVYVPADTPYVFADLESVPEEITDAYVKRFQPAMDVVSKHVEQFQTDFAAGEFQDNAMAQLAAAILDELGGDLSAENLEKFGMDLQAHYAFYGMGVFPVIRFELNDAQKLRNAIGRIEAKMGAQLPVMTLNGIDYWRATDDDNDQPMGMYIAILDQQFVMSAFPVSAEDSLLTSLLGSELPAESMASTNGLAVLNKKKGYTGYGSGILDLQKISDEIFNETSPTRLSLGSEVTAHLTVLDAICVAEIKSMVAKAPRMTAGATRFTANEISTRYDLELEGTLASGLAMLVSDTPVAAEGDYLFSASLAVQVGKLRNFVLEKASNVIATPYQCEMLQELNQNAGDLVTQLNIPMPPMVNNLNGIRVRMDDFDPTEEIIQGKGLLSLHVDKPEMFVGMASMMVPGFDTLDLANQSEPVRIPSNILPIEGIDVFALMGDTAIGAAMGEQYAGDLANFMSAKPRNDGTFLSISHDMAKQMEIQTALTDEMKDDHNQHRDYHKEIQEAYIDMLGRSRVDMRFTSDGLVIDSKMTFK
ncbi:MAG: hypothetical protein GY732_04750 [Gammaproteobacteria bacterium]|nr:hypothetical protein [Gammaproteobacteria bacterium]